jgi:hypothetical protein
MKYLAFIAIAFLCGCSAMQPESRWNDWDAHELPMGCSSYSNCDSRGMVIDGTPAQLPDAKVVYAYISGSGEITWQLDSELNHYAPDIPNTPNAPTGEYTCFVNDDGDWSCRLESSAGAIY